MDAPTKAAPAIKPNAKAFGDCFEDRSMLASNIQEAWILILLRNISGQWISGVAGVT